MTRALLLPLLALVAAPAAMAAKPAPASGTTERIATLVIFGDDPCPRSTADEVVVCARQPESERYRIPKQFRGRQYNAARDGSWAGTAKVLEYISREGLPDSCSPIGSNGQTGCFRKFLEQNAR
ncbi:hypothetical protein [Sphingomonas sp.]|uniref:hypothetical protein n=1 Tax=Sphingomonas sp. TaxID=28214 RepID=UPI003B3A4ECD